MKFPQKKVPDMNNHQNKTVHNMTILRRYMKKAIHKLELNVFLADKILEVLNIHSKVAKNTTNLTGRIHAMNFLHHFFPVSKFALVCTFRLQIGFIMMVSAPQIYIK